MPEDHKQPLPRTSSSDRQSKIQDEFIDNNLPPQKTVDPDKERDQTSSAPADESIAQEEKEDD